MIQESDIFTINGFCFSSIIFQWYNCILHILNNITITILLFNSFCSSKYFFPILIRLYNIII